MFAQLVTAVVEVIPVMIRNKILSFFVDFLKSRLLYRTVTSKKV